PPRNESRGSTRAVRLVEQIEQVHDANVRPGVAEPALDLHEAARVRRDDGVRAGALDVRHLALQDRAGELRLRDVIRAGAAAAPVRLLERDHVQPGDRGKKGAWLRADLLTMQQVAWIVPGHARAGRAGTL